MKTATVFSNNTIELDFPYNGGTTGSIVVRNHPRSGEEVIFSINKGQIICNNCTLTIRFDNGKPFKVKTNQPADYSSTLLFLLGHKRLVDEINTSKKMMVEVVLYQSGSFVFEFDIGKIKF